VGVTLGEASLTVPPYTGFLRISFFFLSRFFLEGTSYIVIVGFLRQFFDLTSRRFDRLSFRPAAIADLMIGPSFLFTLFPKRDPP